MDMMNGVDCRRNLCSVPEINCSLAMAFVPIQPWEELYSDEEAFEYGTAFPSLRKDFEFGGQVND